jgi:hypothetical protein
MQQPAQLPICGASTGRPILCTACNALEIKQPLPDTYIFENDVVMNIDPDTIGLNSSDKTIVSFGESGEYQYTINMTYYKIKAVFGQNGGSVHLVQRDHLYGSTEADYKHATRVLKKIKEIFVEHCTHHF